MQVSRATTFIRTCCCILLLVCSSSNILLVSADDIYLIIGQSNAAGRDINFDYMGRDAPDPNVRILTDSNEIEVALQPLNIYSTIQREIASQGVNLGLEFGKEMYAHTGNPTLLVVNARGSTKIGAWRRGGEDGYFEEAIQRVRTAQNLTGNRLKGILWHQGESDVRAEDTTAYFDDLIDMVREFREELGDETIPFLCGQLFYKQLNQVFNGVLTLVDDKYFPLANMDWVSASHLTTYDNVHFDADSTRELGLRYADTMKEYI